MIDLHLSSRAFAALFAAAVVVACGDDGKTTATGATGASTGNATTDDSTGTASTSTATTDDSTTGDNPTTTDDATTTSGGPISTTTTDSMTATTTDATSTSTSTTDTSTTTDTTSTTTGDGLSFAADVYPIIMASCSCHVGGAPAGLGMSDADTAYGNLVGVPSSQPNGLNRVEAGDPDASHLFLKVTGNQTTGSQMPLGGGPLPQQDLDTIEQWIVEGALP